MVLEEQAATTSTLAEELPQTTPAVDAAVASDAPIDPSLTDSISDALLSSTSNIAPALQYGDLAAMGLASWSPAGIIRWSLEVINVTFSMPWLPTIIVGSLFWKLVCVPFAVKGLQSAARLQPYQAELQAMQAHMNVIRASGNTMEIQKAALRMRDFYKEKNISPMGGLVALAQMPIQLGMFFALQTLCKHPLPQLQANVGVPEFLGQWGQTVLGDLTTGDPTYVLPAIMVALINVQIMINVKDMNTVERPGMAHVMNFIRIVSFGAVPWFFSSFPTGLTVSLLTTSAASIVQAAVMRIPAVRTKLGIPIVPKEAQGVLPSIRETIMYPFRQNLSAKEEVVAARKRAALEQLRNKQRGL
ncbi:60Kd inner membrane protein-domain-containing protein [Panaeolus papilionaceus]|nr:60Kd inner membrane protein-domain-containing protein [Panaeolus papilionaceus]